jgi:hypothetical protein
MGGMGRGTGGRDGTGGMGRGTGGRGGTTGSGGATMANAMMNFFVTSDTSPNGNFGGLTGADQRCQTLAAAVGQGDKTWRAYLSVGSPTAINARDRIGEGPYYNSQGMMLADTKDALHARRGDAALFLDERGGRVNGQWMSSPSPNQHDIYTGSSRGGMLAMNMTCGDWTATTGMAPVGHSDGLGPMMSTADPYPYWESSHNGSCSNPMPQGGAGKIYCFVGP